jgi:GUN4-like
MCQLAGEEAEAREWVYFSEVKDIPAADLITIDSLWKSYSKGRFGFSVQRGIWLAEKRKWGALFKRIGWTMGENKAYRKFPNEFLWQADAPKGHLPLTNCLRGTQLFSALLEHPAFGGPLEPLGVRAQGGGMTSIGGFARGGPPPLESLDPGSRAALVLGAIVFLVLGILNSNTSGSF